MEQVLRTGECNYHCSKVVSIQPKLLTTLDMIEVQLGEEISVADKIKFPME